MTGTVADYVLLGPAGTRASGRTWRAVPRTAPGRVVVVQRLADEAVDPAAVSALAAAVRQLAHPNLLPLLEVITDEAGTAVITPVAAGGSLADLAADGGAGLTPTVVADLGRQLADGLGALHATGWRHGAIRPSNVLLDAAGRPVLADLGRCAPAERTDVAPADDVRDLARTLRTLPIGSASVASGGDGPAAPLAAVLDAATAPAPGDRPTAAALAAQLAAIHRSDEASAAVEARGARGARRRSRGRSRHRPMLLAGLLAVAIGLAALGWFLLPGGSVPPAPRGEAVDADAPPATTAPGAPPPSASAPAPTDPPSGPAPTDPPVEDPSADTRPPPAAPAAVAPRPRIPPPPCSGTPPPPAAPTTSAPTVWADLEGLGCGQPVRLERGALWVGTSTGERHRYALATTAEDRLVAGDWTCDGRERLAVYRPETGEVFRFDALPGPGGEVRATVTPTGVVAGVPTVVLDRDGCAAVDVAAEGGH
jgi:serine/threonine protein kinase